MSCPHSRAPGSSPATCSQCLGAPVRRVDQVGAELVIDGVAVRAVELERQPVTERMRRARVRAGRMGAPRK